MFITTVLLIGLISIVIIPSFIVKFPSVESNLQNVLTETISQSTDFNKTPATEKKNQATDGELLDITVQVKRNASGNIEEVPLEEYVASVVASEMSAKFESEALKAQAIAARTYILNHLLNNKANPIITDTVEHQVYKNVVELEKQWGHEYNEKMAKIKAAVEATESVIITYNDRPITPTFFAMSNGYTEDAAQYWGNELPYLKSVASHWEEDLPNLIEQKVFTFAEINQLLNINLQSLSKDQIQFEKNASNRVKSIKLNGTEFTGREVREKLDLRSTDFSIEQKEGHLIFTTRGYGHGVGMSQYGANEMAKAGKDYVEILTHYYQGIKLTPLETIEPSLLNKL